MTKLTSAPSLLVQHWDARFLTGEPLSDQEQAWLSLGAEMFALEPVDDETSQELWVRLRKAMTDNDRPVRRRRRKPLPHPNERDAIAKAKSATMGKRLPPSARVIPRSGPEGHHRVASRHADDRGWWVQLHDAFGTRSGAVVAVFLDHLSRLAGQTFDRDPDEAKLNAAIAIIHGAKPKNEIEAMLAAQMVAVSWLTMQTTAKALERTYAPEQVAMVAKLARTFAMQSDSLAKLQGRVGKQKITVRYERHSHVHQHRHLHSGGGDPVFEGQAHEQPTGHTGPKSLRTVGLRAAGDDALAALPGPDAPGVAVPMPRHTGEDALPETRRGQGIGRAKG